MALAQQSQPILHWSSDVSDLAAPKIVADCTLCADFHDEAPAGDMPLLAARAETHVAAHHGLLNLYLGPGVGEASSRPITPPAGERGASSC